LENDEKRKKQLENLAFGINSAIIFQDNKNVLILDKDQFDIPETFSQTSWDELKEKLWTARTDFDVMEEKIRRNFKLGRNISKRDKLRKIFNSILKEQDAEFES